LIFKIRKDLTHFTLLFHEVNPHKIRIVINKNDIIFITMGRYNWRWSSNIGVYKFKRRRRRRKRNRRRKRQSVSFSFYTIMTKRKRIPNTR
jgi:hypothetical protein